MPFDLLSLPQDVRNHILVCVAQLPIANLARASRVNRVLNKQWKENPLLLKALLKTTQRLANHCPGPAPLEAVVHQQRPTAFDLAGLPQDLRNHILGMLPIADVARALRVNKQWNDNPLLLKALLKRMHGLAKRATYDVYCPECLINTMANDELADALCVNYWFEHRDDGIVCEHSALACRNCLQSQYESAVVSMDLVGLGANLPASMDEDGSNIHFVLPVSSEPVRSLSAVRGHGVVETQGMEEQPLLEMNSGLRDENPAPDWLLY